MEHYFTEKTKLPFVPIEVVAHVAGIQVTLDSAKGIFSATHMDFATKLLIEAFTDDYISGKEDHKIKKLLDLGCGYGIVAVVVKKVCADVEVHATDINERALKITRSNAKKQGIEIHVVKSDICKSVDKDFDVILTNPPYVAGRDTCFSFIEESHQHLAKKGKLYLVAKHNRGGKVLFEKMEEIFGNALTVSKGKGFHVYTSTKE